MNWCSLKLYFHSWLWFIMIEQRIHKRHEVSALTMTIKFWHCISAYGKGNMTMNHRYQQQQYNAGSEHHSCWLPQETHSTAFCIAQIAAKLHMTAKFTPFCPITTFPAKPIHFVAKLTSNLCFAVQKTKYNNRGLLNCCNLTKTYMTIFVYLCSVFYSASNSTNFSVTAIHFSMNSIILLFYFNFLLSHFSQC